MWDFRDISLARNLVKAERRSVEAIAAMIGSETSAAAATSEEEAEREIQIVEIFNQDVAISGVALAARVLRVGESITSLSLSAGPVSFLTSLKKCVVSQAMDGHGQVGNKALQVHLIDACLCSLTNNYKNQG